jgi:PPM family protein phosphatase
LNKVRPRPIDLSRLTLTAEEGFVLSRVDRLLSIKELVALSGLYEGRVVEIVEHLAQQGAVEVIAEGSPLSGSFAVIDDEIAPPVVDVSVCGLTDTGVVRSNNEDAFTVVDLRTNEVVDIAEGVVLQSGRGVLLAVSDGMGGEKAGEVASALVLDVLRRELANAALTDDPAGDLRIAVENANKSVFDAAAASTEQAGMGATLVSVLIQGDVAYTAEVGDSRAYLFRKRRLTRLTKDQTHIQVLIDQGILTEESAKKSSARSVVLQACGQTTDLVVAQRRLELREGDILLLCSDGLTLHVADEEIALILDSSTVEEASDHLVGIAKDRGGQDNVTVVVAGVSGSLPPPEESLADTLQCLREFSPIPT